MPRAPRNRRTLDYSKCCFCRRDKQKCLPVQRQWPDEKCLRCVQKGFDCSKPQRKQEDGTYRSLLLLSIHSMLILALEELKCLGEELQRSDSLREIHQIHLEKACFEHKNFARILQLQVTRSSPTDPTLLAAALETDYARQSITWLASSDTLQHMDQRIEQLQGLGYHGYAYVLQVKRLMEHPHLTIAESNRLIQCRLQFLQAFEVALEDESIKKHVPKAMLGSQLFMPRRLLQFPAIMEHVREVGQRDCLGRSVSHMAFDAGYQGPWPQSDMDSRDILGRTYLHLVCSTASQQTVACLDTDTWWVKVASHTVIGLGPLHIAASVGNQAICNSILIHDGISKLDLLWLLKDGTGRSAIAWAASCGHRDFINYFTFNFQANSSSWQLNKIRRDIDFLGNTPVSLAVRSGHAHVVECLLSYNYAADTPDKMGRTPYWHAVRSSDFKCMRLLETIANVDHKDNDGRTPLAEAAQQGSAQAVRHLLDLNNDRLVVNPYSMDSTGETPLSIAHTAGKMDCVKVIVEHPSFQTAYRFYRGQIIEQTRRDTIEGDKEVIIDGDKNILPFSDLI